MHIKTMTALAFMTLAATAWLYFPVVHANFVWDDWPSFHNTPLLSPGYEWVHYIFRDFNYWTMYFRPLGVLFLTWQVRLFDGTPGPMHLVSLTLHLVNTLLVGIVAFRCGVIGRSDEKRLPWTTAICMAIYGLHPALIETVAWIGCQFDLLATMLLLLGLFVSTLHLSRTTRALVLALLFFLAACTKESSVIFPMIIVLFDWIWSIKRQESRATPSIGAFLARNIPAYAGMFVAGLVYLGLRYWALGHAMHPANAPALTLLARVQKICFIYLQYWKILLWPVGGMNPIHPVDNGRFALLTYDALLIDFTALLVLFGGLYMAIRRKNTLGYLILGVTIAILPVLHIIPFDFDQSLYHERYATSAIAIACALLPLFRLHDRLSSQHIWMARSYLALITLAALWLMLSAVAVRAILPSWASDVALWRWAWIANPYSPQAKDNLMCAYYRIDDYQTARALGIQFIDDPAPCIGCMLHLATMAMNHHDLDVAQAALARASTSIALKASNETRQIYDHQMERLLILQGHPAEVESPTDAAVTKNPIDKQTMAIFEQALLPQDAGKAMHSTVKTQAR